MTRQERIRTYVEEHYHEISFPGDLPGVDAAMIASSLSIQRSDASAEWNQLCRAGILEKIGKRPVKFLPAGRAKDILASKAVSVAAPKAAPDARAASAPAQQAF